MVFGPPVVLIDERQQWSVRMLNADIAGVRDACVPVESDDGQAGFVLGDRLQESVGTIRGAIVDGHHLDVPARLGEDRLKSLLHERSTVEDRHHH